MSVGYRIWMLLFPGVFLFCWAPFFTISIISAICIRQEAYSGFCQIHPTLLACFVWLGYINSFLNPIIYTIFNVEFRRAFNRLLLCSASHKWSRIFSIFLDFIDYFLTRASRWIFYPNSWSQTRFITLYGDILMYESNWGLNGCCHDFRYEWVLDGVI